MRESELRRALTEEFGDARGGMLMREHWLPTLSSTAADALAAGVAVREVWVAICEEFEIPIGRRHGRGLKNPRESSGV